MHLPAMSLQVFEENATPPFPEDFDQVMVPVCNGYEPITVAMQFIFAPVAIVNLVHDTMVFVGASIASLAVPLLFWLDESPE